MSRQPIVAGFSYDTEMAIGDGLPAYIVSPEAYERLSLDEKKALWGDYVREGVWTDPDHLKRSEQELAMIEALGGLFRSHDGAMTSFVLGQWLDVVVDGLGQQRVRKFYADRDGIDVQSHSYHHKVFGGPQDAVRLRMSPNVPLDEVTVQVKMASDAIERHLEVRPWGLRTPMGNIAPFSEVRILQALSENGIKFVSSWLKRAPTELNSPVDAQPFRYGYGSQGFPDLWEIPGVGKYDVHFIPPSRLIVFGEEGCASRTEMEGHYIGVLEDALNTAEAGHEPVYVPFVFHPWATVLYDPDLAMHQMLLKFCAQNGIMIRSYAQVHEMLISQ